MNQFKQKYENNPNILAQLIKLSALALKKQIIQLESQKEESKERNENLAEIAKLFKHYSYMEQKEYVRVAVAKSLGTLIQQLKLRKEESIFLKTSDNFRAYLDILVALIFILNDESPDIRSYIMQQGLTQIVDSNEYRLEGADLSSSDSTQSIQVDINDKIIVEAILIYITKFLINLNN